MDNDDMFEDCMGNFAKDARDQYSILQVTSLNEWVMCKCSHTSGDGNKDGEALSRISRVLYDKQKYTLEEFFSDIKTF